MQLKVIVKRLNMRRFIPWQIPEPTGIVGQVDEGVTFEGVEVGLAEIPNPSIGKWYRDRDGFYYWGGGVMEVTTLNFAPKILFKNNYYSELSEYINWNESIVQIPQTWKETKGKGIKIAIIDTGVFSNHDDLQGAIEFYKDFTVVDDKIDYDGHGTHVSGIIGARSLYINGISGVAPLAELIILKVLPDGKDGGDLENYQSVIDALDFAVDQGADIINMSLSLRVGEDPIQNEKMKVNGLRLKIKEITDRNITITAAAGDNANLRGKKLFFPSECEGVISVASINQGYFERNPDYSDKLNIAGPTINYLSTFKEPLYYERFGGCSMTSAFVSGVIALVLSLNQINGRNRLSKSQVLSLLNEHSMKLEDMNYGDNSKFYFHILKHS